MNLLRLLRRMTFLSDRRRLEWYPPFWMMRVKVLEMDSQWQRVRLRLPLNAVSRNMGDCMFGGYQASLADPIAALACVKRFPGYSVWTRSMHIDFVAEGNSDLELRFEFHPEVDEQIRKELETRGRSTPRFEYGYYREDGTLCSRIVNTVAIRPRHYMLKSSSRKNRGHSGPETE